MSTFSDRFTFDLNAPPTPEAIAASSDTQLFALFPRLRDMAEMVKRHSVLLKKKTASEVYFTITDHADPSIGLRIAAARDRQGNLLFPDIQTVKQIMFGPSDTDSQFLNPNLNLFVDGVRGASATLAAAILIGQLAQIREQEIHARSLERRAYEDIDRLLQVPDLELLQARPTQDNTQLQAFLFESGELDLSLALQVDVFLPALSNVGTAWTPVGTYNGQVSVASIVADIADTINVLTLNSSYSNVLAAPVLSSPRISSVPLHQIEFQSRFRDLNIAAEVVTVRIRHIGAHANQPIPFRWGVNENRLEPVSVNSLILAVQASRVAAVAAGQNEADFEPTVLWFRRASSDPLTGDILDGTGSPIPAGDWQASNLAFRISPTMSQDRLVPFSFNANRLDERPGDFAVLLLNEMFMIKQGSRALGAIIRNDDPNATNPLTAVELIAFSVSNPETMMVLDLIQLPADIQVAVGDTRRPLTPFSSRPRSVRVRSQFDWRFEGNSATDDGRLLGPDARLVEILPSHKLSKVQDKLMRIRGHV